MLGRVVPIKDVKTFIRAIRTLVNRLPEAEGWIAGPEDEDPAYAEECHQVAESLGLKDKVKFLGFQRIDELLPKVGMLAISSISEALPLVILEGFAAGVPAISTDVGSCRQLIFGLGPEDEALGAAGDIVGIADPEALGMAAVRLFSDLSLWKSAQAAGIARVEGYYTQDMMFAKYRALYQKSLSDAPVPPSDVPAAPSADAASAPPTAAENATPPVEVPPEAAVPEVQMPIPEATPEAIPESCPMSSVETKAASPDESIPSAP
jgi:glycosyltransferase involved in cell wall biosynthesis